MGQPLAKAKISPEEMERRRRHVEIADADNRIEGIFRDRDSDGVFDAYIAGEIEVTEIGPLLMARKATR